MLLIIETTYQQGAVFLGYNISVETLHDNPFSRRDMHDAVSGIEHLNGIAYTGIVVLIARQQSVKRPPCSQIGPTEIGRKYIYVGGFFHDGIVDRYVLTQGEIFIDCNLFVCGIECRDQPIEYPGYGRAIVSECLFERGGTP